MIAGFEGVVPADKGFIDAWRQVELAKKRHIELVTPARKNMKLQPLSRNVMTLSGRALAIYGIINIV